MSIRLSHIGRSTIFAALLLSTIGHAQTFGVPEPDLNALRPPQRLWDEVKVLQAPYLLPEDEARVEDCPAWDEFRPQPNNTVYQNFLYANYYWHEYELPSGNRCIDLVTPDVGLLSAQDARILLSASAGLGFEENAFYNEANSFHEIYQSALTSNFCGTREGESSPSSLPAKNGASSKERRFFAKKRIDREGRGVSHEFRPPILLNGFTVDCELIRRTPSIGEAVQVKAQGCPPGSPNCGIHGLDDRVAISGGSSPFLPDTLIVRIKAEGEIGNGCPGNSTGFFVNPWSIATAAHVLRFENCLQGKFSFWPLLNPAFRGRIEGDPFSSPSWPFGFRDRKSTL